MISAMSDSSSTRRTQLGLGSSRLSAFSGLALLSAAFRFEAFCFMVTPLYAAHQAGKSLRLLLFAKCPKFNGLGDNGALS